MTAAGGNAAKAVIAVVHRDDVAMSFTNSLVGLVKHDAEHHGRLWKDGPFGLIEAYAGPMQIPKARNELVEQFLDLHEPAEWLCFVDADMGLEPSTLEALIASADPEERPVVGGLCFAARAVGVGASQSFRMHWYPTIYRWSESDDSCGFDVVYDYPRDALVQSAGTGGALLLIHRSVLERMREQFGNGEWFRPVTYRGTDFSEDLSFSLRLIQMGVPLFINTAVKTSHMKSVWVDEDYFDHERRNSARDVYVVIPVKDQLPLTRALLSQLRQQGNYEGIFVYDNGSGPEMKEWLAGQDVAEVFDADGLNIHEMWNRGIAEALERDPDCDVAILNNDLRLGHQFLAKLADGLHSDPRLLAVCGRYDGRQMADKVARVHGVCAGRYDGTGGFAGFAFMLRNDFVKDYRFPENLAWWYGDNDMLATVVEQGGWYGMVRDAVVEHLDGGSVTTRSQSDADKQRFSEAIAADKVKFEAVWETTPFGWRRRERDDDVGSVHPKSA